MGKAVAKASMRSAALAASYPNTAAQVGVSYAASVFAVGGVAPYTFAVIAGALPAGLALNAGTGAVTGTPTTAGSYSFTVRVTDAAAATKDVGCTIAIAQPSGASVIGTITAYSVTDDVADRWQIPGGTNPLQAVTPNTISCSAYPQPVTIWSVSPQYGRVWHKQYLITGAAQVVNIGAPGTDTSIFPPTATTSETVRFWAAIGAYGADVDPTTIAGAVHFDVTVSGPAAPGATDATGFYFTSAAPTYAEGSGGASMYGWKFQGHLPITAADTPDKFWAFRLCRQTGKYVAGVWTPGGEQPIAPDPTNPLTVVGDYAGPTAWYANQDHADNVSGDPATGIIVWANPNLWTVRSDGYPVTRYYGYIESRRSGGTWVQQNAWSAAAGTATPGTSAYQELTVDQSKAAITSLLIVTASGTVVKVDVTTTGVEIDGAAGYKTLIPGGSITLQNPYGALSLTPLQLLSSAALDIQAASVETNDLTVASKFHVDGNGRLTTYDNVALSGKGIPHIVWAYEQTAQTGGTTISPTIGGAAPVGHFEVAVSLVARATGASPAGAINIAVRASFTGGGIAGTWSTVLSQNFGVATAIPSGFSPVSFYTDGTTVSGIAGIQIQTSVTTPWSNASYDIYITIKKIGG